MAATTDAGRSWAGITRAATVGICLGTAYGIVARLVAQEIFVQYFKVLSVWFLVLVPIAIGYITVFTIERPRWWYVIFAPWAPMCLAVFAAVIWGWEGSICVVLSTPLLLLFSSVGGMLASLHRARRVQHAAVIVFLPFVAAPLESLLPHPERIERNVTEILVDAPANVVWRHVISVPEITAGEQRAALYTRIGFPRPISATLSQEGLGGVRHARFAGGVLFIEKITAWEHERRIAFTIDAQEDSIPATTLDPHVTIGGQYFDVLTGEYLLVSSANGQTRVVLSSSHRVSTSLNPYSAWWARTIMRSIQRNILEVVKQRAETDRKFASPKT